MESRLRKFWSPRRTKPQSLILTNDELPTPPPPSKLSPSQGRLPSFFNHALRRPSSSKSRHPPSRDVPTFSYDSTIAGPIPEIGEKPQRGNGPVKLQASRRLSSGELLVTQQDYERTLEEIRQGDFILPGKEKRSSRPSPPLESSVDSSALRVISTAPNSPASPSSSPSLSSIPHSINTHDLEFPRNGLPIYGNNSPSHRSFSSSALVRPSLDSYRHSVSMQNGPFPPSPRLSPRAVASTVSLRSRQEDQTPTLRALWKAEYGRLMSLYGQNQQDKIDPTSMRLPEQGCPIEDNSFDDTPRNPSSEFNNSLCYLDVAHSDGSSNTRDSILSRASSSCMTRTNLAEDYATPREDIRRIVHDMRINYLNAIEAHTPPTQPLPDVPAQSLRTKKMTPSLTSSISVESGLSSAKRGSGSTRTRSWQSTASSHPATTPRTSTSSPPSRHPNKRKSTGNSRRTSSRPVSGLFSLPAIEASPVKGGDNNENVGLKRADSTTLGAMEKSLVILSIRGSQASSHPPLASPSTSTFFHSDSDGGSTLNEGKASPLKESSTQASPEMSSLMNENNLVTKKSSWHAEADRLFADADHEPEISDDINDFEALCNDLFNTSESGVSSDEEVVRRDSDTVTPTLAIIDTTIPPKHGVTDLKGLGLSGLHALA
ncbi:hypothetical protein PV10_07204 [Exophiala mesophila]|uniref:Uncharacterized protein n=1 Tax=Exophiala mesophila TaxID=212818 RepID=A0A0D1ZSL9_EXOME|nr:uncharacterized protein PV10_07204 [Exophiala mesophila]KIV89833.1 hypothetical protein PV10_07204 [Exophiala mesophila]